MVTLLVTLGLTITVLFGAGATFLLLGGVSADVDWEDWSEDEEAD